MKMPGKIFRLFASRLNKRKISFKDLQKQFIPIDDILGVVIKLGFPHFAQPVEVGESVEEQPPPSVHPTVDIMHHATLSPR